MNGSLQTPAVRFRHPCKPARRCYCDLAQLADQLRREWQPRLEILLGNIPGAGSNQEPDGSLSWEVQFEGLWCKELSRLLEQTSGEIVRRRSRELLETLRAAFMYLFRERFQICVIPNSVSNIFILLRGLILHRELLLSRAALDFRRNANQSTAKITNTEGGQDVDILANGDPEWAYRRSQFA
jgi:hypothetical protein